MSENNNGEAAELATLATQQGKASARSAGRAAKAAAEPIIEKVVDEAQDTAVKFEATADDVLDAVRSVNPQVWRTLSKEAGLAVLATAVCAYSGKFAFVKIFHTIGYAKGVRAAHLDLNES